MSREEFHGSFPIEGVTCGRCGSDGCLMYPDTREQHGAPAQHFPTTICPACSNASIESALRFAAERGGYKLKLISVFDQRPTGLLAQMIGFAEEAGTEVHSALERAWHATPDGSNSTADFFSDGDGQILYAEDGPKPSYGLAMLFDFERFMGGNPCALEWKACTEATS